MHKKIIWADNDAVYMDCAIPLFNDHGFDVIPCYTTGAALKEINLRTSNNLLLDVDFPTNRKEGLDFLLEKRQELPHLNVVIFTAYPELDDAVRVLKEKLAADYIMKSYFDAARFEKFFEDLHKAYRNEAETVDVTNRHFSQNRGKFEKIRLGFETYDLTLCEKAMKALFAGLSKNIKVREGYFHAIIQVLLDGIGLDVRSEVETNIGRIDAVVETEKFIYLLEFKLSTAKAALQQIKDRRYFEKYLVSDKRIILVGIAFNTATGSISEIEHEELL